MRSKLLLPAALAVLVLAGASCPGKGQPASTANKPAAETTAAPQGKSFRLLDKDGKPLPDNIIRHTHVVGRSTCPDHFAPTYVDFGAKLKPSCDLRLMQATDYLEEPRRVGSNRIVGQGVVMGLDFNCNINDRSTHLIEVEAGFALDCEGDELGVPEGGGWSNGDRVDVKVELDVKTQADADKEAGTGR